jgi:hypothetical protein
MRPEWLRLRNEEGRLIRKRTRACSYEELWQGCARMCAEFFALCDRAQLLNALVERVERGEVPEEEYHRLGHEGERLVAEFESFYGKDMVDLIMRSCDKANRDQQ